MVTKTTEAGATQEPIERPKSGVWVYIGKRVTTDKKLSHFWIRDGEETPFGRAKQIAPAMIGECWEHFETDDGRVWTSGQWAPKRVEERAIDPRFKQWTVEEQAALRWYSEMKIKKHLASRESAFQQALQPLREMLNAVNNLEHRAAFIAQVQAQLWKRS